jgi:diguanylate cyclase (GGDEF)-like protein
MVMRRRLLLVDDDGPTRELLRELGESSGFEVDLAPNGREALVASARNVPDLVVLDVVMPEMDGLEVLEKLRGSAQTKETPVLLVSAKLDMAMKIRGMELGADDFISKPFKVEELKTRIRAALDASDRKKRATQAGGELDELRATDPGTRAGTYAQLKAGLESEFQRAKRYGRPLAALRVGLQEFTSLRSQLGIDGCERLMRGLAERLRGALRGADRLYRMDADELVVLLPETDLAGARVAAERLGRLIHSHGEGLELGRATVRARIGGAALPHPAITHGEELLREANQSFRGLTGGRGAAVVFDTDDGAEEDGP